MQAVKQWCAKNWDFLTDFRRGKPWSEKFSVVVTILAIDLLYVFGMIWLLNKIYGAEDLSQSFYRWWGKGSGINVSTALYNSIHYNLRGALFSACVLAPFWEEFAFRTYWLWKIMRQRTVEAMTFPENLKQKVGKLSFCPFVIFSSLIFGVAHGGALNILIQGVGGAFLAYVFLRTGRSYLAAVALHASYNATVIVAAYMGSKSAVYALTLPIWYFWS